MRLSTLFIAQAVSAISLNLQSPLTNLNNILEYAGVSAGTFKQVVVDAPEVFQTWRDIMTTHSSSELKHLIDQFQSSQFTPKNTFQDILKQNDKFEVLTSTSYPDYSLRTSKSDPSVLGIDTVKQYSGYLDHAESHFFYYFFESRNDPENDPVILWLNGGPGCSSMTGLFFELGPSSIGPELKPIYNPYAWNSNASVVFLEQPIGVGYSYGDKEVSNSYAAAKDVFIFLELFFQKFPQFVKNDFHIAGESYAGHYIPAIASEIINHADRSFELTSVMIGNGITDSLVQNDYYQPMACGKGGHKAVLTEEQCDIMKKSAKRCSSLTSTCYRFQNAFTCVPAMVYCNGLLEPYVKTGLNVYDIRGPCDGGNSLCYKGLDYVEQYLNKQEVQQALGSEVQQYVGCNDQVGRNFALTGDEAKPFQGFVAELLEKGYPVLIYAGDKDFICNWLGNHAWTDDLDWILAPSYREEVLKPWKSSLGPAGEVKSFGGLTFLRIFEAGHMVPYDQPENALAMVNTWISGEHSFGY
jgi:cathepsin A (carboxypeptidase C)